MMPPWLSCLTSAIKKEKGYQSARWIQLATIGLDNTPRVRTVVFRGWSKLYEMEIYTDQRSEKYNELSLNNNVEICWIFLKSRCQFRFRGISNTDFVNDNEKLYHWDKLDDRSKTMWLWPKPGEKFNIEENKYLSAKKQKKISDNFALLKIEINHVDQLILQKPIHTRRKWIKKGEWVEERINP